MSQDALRRARLAALERQQIAAAAAETEFKRLQEEEKVIRRAEEEARLRKIEEQEEDKRLAEESIRRAKEEARNHPNEILRQVLERLDQHSSGRGEGGGQKPKQKIRATIKVLTERHESKDMNLAPYELSYTVTLDEPIWITGRHATDHVDEILETGPHFRSGGNYGGGLYLTLTDYWRKFRKVWRADVGRYIVWREDVGKYTF